MFMNEDLNRILFETFSSYKKNVNITAQQTSLSVLKIIGINFNAINSTLSIFLHDY